MKLRKVLSLVLVLSMVLTLAAACGKKTDEPAKDNTPAAEDSGKDNDNSNDSDNNTDSEADSADGPIEINVGYKVSWDTLTPFRSNIANNAPYSYIIYESLACLDEDGNNVPWVAKSWNSEDGGFTYDIEIYDYVTDSLGNKITAADIVWMIEASQEASLKPSFRKVESVEQDRRLYAQCQDENEHGRSV